MHSRRKFLAAGAVGLVALGVGYLYRDRLYSLTESLLAPKLTATPTITTIQTLTPTVSPTPLSPETPGKLVDLELQLFHDYHGDGTKQSDEPFITNASFDLIDEVGNKILTDIKGSAYGIYQFKSLKENTSYRLISSENSKIKFRHVSISNEEFHPLEQYWINPDPDETRLQLGLMNGFLTSPFGKGALPPISDYFDRGNGRGWKGKRSYVGHTGTDFYVTEGTTLLSPVPGIITVAKATYYNKALYLALDFNNMRVTYAHISRSLVSVGQKIKRGETIAISGSTGTSTAHLHFELAIINAGSYLSVDPFGDSSYWTKDNDPQYPLTS